MLPQAIIVHEMPHRLRLRIPARKGDAAYFAQLEKTMAGHENVRLVEGNPTTAGLLLLHDSDPETLAAFAEGAGLLTLVAPQPKAVLSTASHLVDDLDSRLQIMSNGRVDLNEFLFIGILGITAVQILRGQIVSHATSLLGEAAVLLQLYRQKQKDNPAGDTNPGG